MNNAVKKFTTIEPLKKISSLELDRAIANMGGKENLYLSLIANFYKAQHSIESTLNLLLEDKKWDELYRIVHTLKTNTAYIGAFNISLLCGEVEAELEEKKQNSFSILKLSNQLGILINHLGACEENTIDKETTQYSKEAISSILLNIKSFLETSNLDVETRLPSLQAMVKNSLYEEDINHIIALILNVEYEKAVPLIENILVKIDG